MRSHLAVLNITVDKERLNGRKQWRWSSDDAEVPQQRPGRSDCGLMTVLFAIFTARGWDIRGLSSLDPKTMRGWFLRVLHSQGQWKRAWSCTECGHETKYPVTVDKNRQCITKVQCGKAQRGRVKSVA